MDFLPALLFICTILPVTSLRDTGFKNKTFRDLFRGVVGRKDRSSIGMLLKSRT